MSDAVLTVLAILVVLAAAGLLCGIADRRNVAWRWLAIAMALIVVNDAFLTNIYGLLPNVFADSDWNWQGKLLALIATLAIAMHPAFGLARSGITLRQNTTGRPVTYAVIAAMLILFAIPALLSDNDALDPETLAFQLTLPGLEEEPFYRGILLLALNEAFRGRWHVLGIAWSWGALLSCLVFGLVHALDVDDGILSFDIMTMAMTGVPALILVWLRERTGSLLAPVLLHNYANAIGHLV